MRTRAGFAAAMAALVLIASAQPVSAQELMVSAAVSMKEALEQVGRTFTARRPGVTLRFNFGASGELQQQVEAGAPIDVFVSAGMRQMDELKTRGLIAPDSARVFARNVLVAVEPADSALPLAQPKDLLGPRVRRVAIGDPRTVPAGRYAEECLRALGLWEHLQPRLILGQNVRQVLDYVARGEVDAGFVYATDAAARRDGVREAFRPSENTYQPILYPAAAVAGSPHAALAQVFVEHLTSADARATLERLGFLPPIKGQ